MTSWEHSAQYENDRIYEMNICTSVEQKNVLVSNDGCSTTEANGSVTQCSIFGLPLTLVVPPNRHHPNDTAPNMSRKRSLNNLKLVTI